MKTALDSQFWSGASQFRIFCSPGEALSYFYVSSNPSLPWTWTRNDKPIMSPKRIKQFSFYVILFFITMNASERVQLLGFFVCAPRPQMIHGCHPKKSNLSCIGNVPSIFSVLSRKYRIHCAIVYTKLISYIYGC